MSDLIVFEYRHLDCCSTAISEPQLAEIGRAKVLSLSKEKERQQFTPSGIGYAPTRYIAIVRSEIDVNKLALPEFPIYARAEQGIAWLEASGAIVETNYLSQGLWRLIIDPAKPLPYAT